MQININNKGVKYLQEDSKKDKVTFIKNFFSKSFYILLHYTVLISINKTQIFCQLEASYLLD